MRLFTALPLSEDIVQACLLAAEKSRKEGICGRMIPPENLHVTLAFIGETEEPGAVISALGSVSFQPFRLSLGDACTYRDMLWIRPLNSLELSRTASLVRLALDQAGISYDRKPFVPHITMMRRTSGNLSSMPLPETSMTVNEIRLMQSVFINNTTVYREVFCLKAEQ